jgi:nucleotide-binding universal stress UspA family protein
LRLAHQTHEENKASMAHVSHKLSNSVEGALAAGGDPATSPLYVFGPFLRLIVVSGVAAVTFGATIWLVVFTIAMVSAMYRLVMLWVTDGSGGSGLSEEEFGGWAAKVNASITFVEYTLTFLVSMAALVTFLADRLPVLNASILGIQYRTLVAILLSIAIGYLVNRGPKTSAFAFGPATAGVLLLLWAMIGTTIWQYGFHLPALNWQAFTGDYLHFTFGGFTRMLAVMTGIEVFANLVAAYDGQPRQRSNKAFGSLLIIMGTTAVTMLIVGPAIANLSDATDPHVSVFTQTMDQLLPAPLPYLGTVVSVLVLGSAAAASAQGLQNLALGLKTRNYIPAPLGQQNRFGVADKPVWLEVGLVTVIFLLAGTKEETYLAIYAAGVFVLLSMTGWAATKRLLRELRQGFTVSYLAILVGTVLAATITTVATVVIFQERFFEGAWTYFVFIPLLYAAFSYVRGRLGAPSSLAERLGELEGAMLGGFGFGQSFAVQTAGRGGVVGLPVTASRQQERAAATPTRPWQRARGTPRHVLVALDGSNYAEQALPAAESICKAFNARLTLVSVLPQRSRIWPFGRSKSEPKAQGGGRRKLEAYLQGVAKRMEAKGVDVNYSVLRGPVAESVNRLMEEQAIDMSIISTHGRSGLQRWVLGSVARRLVQLVTRPVLIIHPAPDGPPPVPGFAKLLVALDGSEFAERVLPMVRASTIYGSVVHLLRVPDVPEPQRYGTMVEEIQRLRAEAEAEARQYLEGIAQPLREEGIETHVLVAGSRPAETIIEVAEAEDVDVIMISTHGEGGLESLLVGSVADRVVQQTHRPVLLVPIYERRFPASEELS